MLFCNSFNFGGQRYKELDNNRRIRLYSPIVANLNIDTAISTEKFTSMVVQKKEQPKSILIALYIF